MQSVDGDVELRKAAKGSGHLQTDIRALVAVVNQVLTAPPGEVGVDEEASRLATLESQFVCRGRAFGAQCNVAREPVRQERGHFCRAKRDLAEARRRVA